MAFALTDIERGPAPGVPTAIVYAEASLTPLLTDPVTQALAYLDRRGKTRLASLAPDTDAQENRIVLGTEFIENQARCGNLTGFPVYAEGELLMPRWDLIVDDRIEDPAAIPLKYLRLCWEASELAVDFPLDSVVVEAADRNLILSHIGPTHGIEKEWGNSGDGREALNEYSKIVAGLKPFLGPLRSTRG